MKIGDLTKQTGVSATTIRHYEAEGLLSPPMRSDNNYRTYGASHVVELRFVRNCRDLDMTFDEIRALKSLRDRRDVDCGVANSLLEEHIKHVDHELHKLQQIRAELVQLHSLCGASRAVADCEIFSGIATREPKRAEQNNGTTVRKRRGV